VSPVRLIGSAVMTPVKTVLRSIVTEPPVTRGSRPPA
jgi:hypothetical protein